MQASRRTADFLLSVPFLVALVVLVVNDFILKRTVPSYVTGKLSDLAGPVVASLVAVAGVEVISRRRDPDRWAAPSWFLACAVIVVVTFGAIKLTDPGTEFYVNVNAWLIDAARRPMSLFGDPTQPVEVSVIRDPWDVVLALLAIPGVYAVGVRWRRPPTKPSTSD